MPKIISKQYNAHKKSQRKANQPSNKHQKELLPANCLSHCSLHLMVAVARVILARAIITLFSLTCLQINTCLTPKNLHNGVASTRLDSMFFYMKNTGTYHIMIASRKSFTCCCCCFWWCYQPSLAGWLTGWVPLIFQWPKKSNSHKTFLWYASHLVGCCSLLMLRYVYTLNI